MFKGKVICVTGGASGLGQGICSTFAKLGAIVVIIDMNKDAGLSFEQKLLDDGHDARAYSVNVTDKKEVITTIKDVMKRFGHIYGLVNAAGVIAAPGFEDSKKSRIEDWQLLYEVNIKGVTFMIEAVMPYMKKVKDGKIVNISSISGRSGSVSGNSAYAATKSAVINLTQSYALELAPYNVNVNAICPGSLWTPMWEKIAERIQKSNPDMKGITGRQIFEERVKKIPLGREQMPEDIGNVASFFMSDSAKNITGQSLNVDGGSRMD